MISYCRTRLRIEDLEETNSSSPDRATSRQESDSSILCLQYLFGGLAVFEEPYAILATRSRPDLSRLFGIFE